MRVIDPELQARLDTGATTLCRCWLVTRRDGTNHGFTDHDRDLTIDGIVYAAETGVDAATLQSGTGLSVDNGQVVGALRAVALSENDIRVGKFDNAEVRHWLVDWKRPDLRILMFRGSLGEIRRRDGAFEAEVRGLAEKLNVPVGRNIMRTCDRVLGDTKCRFDTSAPGFAAEAVVREVRAGGRIVSDGLGGFEPGWFAHGTLTWLDGANAGTIDIVRAGTVLPDGRRVLDLGREPRLPVGGGDRFRVVAGCDKRAETCREKFNNFLNFRGFPHIPGEDWVVAYPREGSVHDGGSLGRS